MKMGVGTRSLEDLPIHTQEDKEFKEYPLDCESTHSRSSSLQRSFVKNSVHELRVKIFISVTRAYFTLSLNDDWQEFVEFCVKEGAQEPGYITVT